MTLGLMTRFRGQSNSLAELAAMQVLKGIANGFIAFPCVISPDRIQHGNANTLTEYKLLCSLLASTRM